MATYPPPTETLPIFDAGVFTTNDTTLTIAQADARYLKFPTGQGTETIPTLVVSGTATIGTATIDSIAIKQPTGANNIVVGYSSLNNSTSASYDNVAFGRNIATGVLTGNNNVFLGNGGFGVITSASNNTSVGANNGGALTTGNSNTIIGKDVMNGLTTGTNNIGIGSSANITGNPTNCTIIGADATCASYTKSTAIGKDATATASNQVVLGTSTESVIIPNSIAIKGTQPIKGIVCGTATTANPGGATSVTGTKSFGYTFANAPIVIITHRYSGLGYVISAGVTATTTTYFDYSWVFSGGFSVPLDFSWIAIGS